MRDCLKLNLGSFCHLMLKARGVNWTLGVGLLIETSFAVGLSSTLIAQLTGTVPPSGVLITPPPAPGRSPAVWFSGDSRAQCRQGPQFNTPLYKRGRESKVSMNWRARSAELAQVECPDGPVACTRA